MCGKFFHISNTCCFKMNQYANHTQSPSIGSAAYTKLVKETGSRHCIPGILEGVPNDNRKAEGQPAAGPRKDNSSNWNRNKIGKLLTTLTSCTTTCKYLFVKLTSLPKEASVRMEVEALLGTGDFISENVVVRFNLKPVISAASSTLCKRIR